MQTLQKQSQGGEVVYSTKTDGRMANLGELVIALEHIFSELDELVEENSYAMSFEVLMKLDLVRNEVDDLLDMGYRLLS